MRWSAAHRTEVNTRVISVLLVLAVLLLTTAVTTAKAPAREPVGNLADVKRSILFPNLNILFDIQSGDPDALCETCSKIDRRDHETERCSAL
ncbi:MAG: hypothetical protein QGI10_01180 [Vicinamibacterales bacterium]|nr:hypothetical protein [Vicinamibacterales bacterium]